MLKKAKSKDGSMQPNIGSDKNDRINVKDNLTSDRK